ncbi:sensor histidine kinase [Streptomyces sp. 4N509B]|uniref:sensor histidine kinase n=1 Tax=Streptomyces sp. 4N509B TaxID=3457413 RepID=UPI003FD61FD6
MPATGLRRRRRAWPPSARGRLTLLLTVLVLAAGVVLTALTYLLTRRGIGLRLVSVRFHASPRAEGEPPPAPEVEDTDLSGPAREAMLAELLAQAPLALAAVTLLAAALGWLVAGRVLRPVRTIAATARRLSAERLDERVLVRQPPDELAALAETVNGMLDRIQAGVAERERLLASQRLFTANAAHELRTPLATIRAAVDVTLDGEPTRAELLTMAADVRTAAAHSQRTLDGLLALARSQAGLRERRHGDLAELAAALATAAEREAARRGLTLRATLRPAPVTGEPVLLERLVGNLLDNALRYNHRGGHVTLATGTDERGAFLRVENSGPPVSPAAAARLLEPFVRGETDGAGTDGLGTDGGRDGGEGVGAGLGLSIVRAVTAAHEGELTTAPRPAGGLTVRVRLPAAAGAPTTRGGQRLPRNSL